MVFLLPILFPILLQPKFFKKGLMTTHFGSWRFLDLNLLLTPHPQGEETQGLGSQRSLSF